MSSVATEAFNPQEEALLLKKKNSYFWRPGLWSDETEIELCGYNDRRYVWTIKGEACQPENTIPNENDGGGGATLWACFAAGGDWCTLTKEMAP